MMPPKKIEKIIIASFKLPVKFENGYIFDANNQMMMEVRAWGHLQYLPNSEALQDGLGEMFANAFNHLYRKPNNS